MNLKLLINKVTTEMMLSVIAGLTTMAMVLQISLSAVSGEPPIKGQPSFVTDAIFPEFQVRDNILVWRLNNAVDWIPLLDFKELSSEQESAEILFDNNQLMYRPSSTSTWTILFDVMKDLTVTQQQTLIPRIRSTQTHLEYLSGLDEWISFLSLDDIRGPVGPSGSRGLSGSQGPQGPQGSQGPQGPEGPRGVQGLTGSSGLNGLDGTNGSVVTIGVNGHWLIDGVDTGVSATGSGVTIFDEDGRLVLPVNGDIVNVSGVSVLGGSTGTVTFTNNRIAAGAVNELGTILTVPTFIDGSTAINAGGLFVPVGIPGAELIRQGWTIRFNHGEVRTFTHNPYIANINGSDYYVANFNAPNVQSAIAFPLTIESLDYQAPEPYTLQLTAANQGLLIQESGLITLLGSGLLVNQSGILQYPWLTDVPTSAVGKPGDLEGMIAFDGNYLYIAVANYTGVSQSYTAALAINQDANGEQVFTILKSEIPDITPQVGWTLVTQDSLASGVITNVLGITDRWGITYDGPNSSRLSGTTITLTEPLPKIWRRISLSDW